MKLNYEQACWLVDMRKEWYRLVDPFGVDRAKVFVEYPKVDQELLNSSRIYSDRLSAIVATVQPCLRGIEVGTQAGKFAEKLLSELTPSKLVLMDLTDEYIKKSRPELLVHPSVELLIGDSVRALTEIEDGTFDWIYIDANHDFEGVAADLRESARVVKSGGLIVLNDYTIWSPLEMIPYGVVQAVNIFLLENKWNVEYFAFDDWMYCDIAIRKP